MPSWAPTTTSTSSHPTGNFSQPVWTLDASGSGSGKYTPHEPLLVIVARVGGTRSRGMMGVGDGGRSGVGGGGGESKICGQLC